MTGGLIQLVAKGVEDVIMTHDPNITLFKTIYRRHTNFSFEDHILNFKKKLDFGTHSVCNLEHYGDLVHKLYLVIELPKLELYNKILTKNDIVNLMKSYGINVLFSNTHTEVTDDDIIMLRNLVINRVTYLSNQLTNYNNISDVITLLNPTNIEYLDMPLVDYYNLIIKNLINVDNNYIFYSFIIALKKDRTVAINVKKYQDILTLFMLNLSHLFINIPNYSGITYLIDIFDFQSYIEFSKFSVTSNNINIIFNDVIEKYYQTNDYKNLDSYVFYNKYLNNIIINTSPTENDIYAIKINLLNYILTNITNNNVILYDLFNIFKTNTNIPIYKKYKSSGTLFKEIQKFIPYLTITNIFYKITNYVTDYEFDYGNYVKQLYTSFINNLLNVMTGVIDTFMLNNLDMLNNITFSKIILDLDTYLNYNYISKVIFLNYIPLITLTNITQSLSEYFIFKIANINDPLDEYSSSFSNILNYCQTIINDNSTIIGDILYVSPDELREIIKNVININTNDIIVYVNFKVINGNVMDIIKLAYYQVIDYSTNILPIGDVSTNIISDIKGIIDSYFSLNIISYTEYKNNNNRIYNYGNPNTSEIFDMFSSYWYIIQKTYISEYNNLFKNAFSYGNNLGSEISLYLNDILYSDNNIIDSRLFDLSGGVLQSYVNNYYTFTKDIIFNNELLLDITGALQTINDILDYISGKQTILNNLITNYNNYKQLLNARYISLSLKQYYYNTTENIINKISDVMINNSLYGYSSNITKNEELTNMINEAKIYTKNAMDIINESFSIFVTNMLSDQHLVSTINLILWFNEYVINLSQDEKINTISAITNIINTITSEYLYNNINIILDKYNNFNTEHDVYNYLLNIFENYNKNIGELINYINLDITYTTNIELYNLLTTYITNKTTNIMTILYSIDNSNSTEYKLITKILDGLKKTISNFAWTNEIGHKIIEKININIGGEIIDEHDSDLLHILSSLNYSPDQYNGYNKLIGNTKELTEINNKIKKQQQIYIPLSFWFNRYATSSLPLISLIHTYVTIYVKLRKKEELIVGESNIDISNVHIIKCYILAQYIYVENTERIGLCKNKLEYLIDIFQYTKFETISNGDIIYDYDSNGTITIKLNFKDMCKELIWFVQINGKSNWTDYTNNTKRIIKKMKLLFNNRERETNYYEHTNLIYSYERHKTTLLDGIHIYPFSLYPILLQPSGTANLSKLYDCKLLLYLDDDIIKLMNTENITLKVGVYAFTYNILRILSGMGGLVFRESTLV